MRDYEVTYSITPLADRTAVVSTATVRVSASDERAAAAAARRAAVDTDVYFDARIDPQVRIDHVTEVEG